jgi:hypothetical protein
MSMYHPGEDRKGDISSDTLKRGLDPKRSTKPDLFGALLGSPGTDSFPGFATLFANELVDDQGNSDELDEGVNGWYRREPILRWRIRPLAATGGGGHGQEKEEENDDVA